MSLRTLTKLMSLQASRHVLVPVGLAALYSTGPALAQDDGNAPQTFSAAADFVVPQKKPPTPRSLGVAGAFDGGNVMTLPALGPEDVFDGDHVPPINGRVFEIAADPQVDGTWTELPDGGKLWTLAVRSINAYALRIRFEPFNPPEGAELIVHNAAQPAEAYGPFGKGRAQTDLPFWGPTVYGKEVRIEYYLPPELAGEKLPAHLKVTGALQVFQPAEGPELACRLDWTCDADWEVLGRSVAHIQFVDGGSGFICSGAMLNRLPAFDATPYFLTAAHCISTQTVASTIEVYWLFQSSVCNGPDPNLNDVPRTLGSTLLATEGPPDHTLLGLTPDDIPGGLVWAGWNSALVPNPTVGVEIHHPCGVAKSISYGTFEGIDGAEPCAAPIDITYRFDLSDGGQEGGSSGAPVFATAGQQIRAVVSCSETPGCACDPGENCWEGSFNSAYDTLQPFINPASSDVWVNIAYGGVEKGTQAQPFDTLVEGYFAVPAGGRLHVVGGTYPQYSFLGTKNFEIVAETSSVLIE